MFYSEIMGAIRNTCLQMTLTQSHNLLKHDIWLYYGWKTNNHWIKMQRLRLTFDGLLKTWPSDQSKLIVKHRNLYITWINSIQDNNYFPKIKWYFPKPYTYQCKFFLIKELSVTCCHWLKDEGLLVSWLMVAARPGQQQ